MSVANSLRTEGDGNPLMVLRWIQVQSVESVRRARAAMVYHRVARARRIALRYRRWDASPVPTSRSPGCRQVLGYARNEFGHNAGIQHWRGDTLGQPIAKDFTYTQSRATARDKV